MGIKLKNKNYPLFAVCFMFAAVSIFTSCKSTKTEEVFFEKIVHPREYYFDIYEVDDYPKLKKDKKTDIMSFSIDFSDFVKYDSPQAGDKLIFKYKCKSNKDIPGTLYAYLEYPDSSEGEKQIFASNLKKKEFFENQLTFEITQNLENVKFIVEYSEPIKYSTIIFSFEEVLKSTDTKQEQKELEKAIKKGYTLIDKNTGLRLDNGLPPELPPQYDEEEIENEEVKDDDIEDLPNENNTESQEVPSELQEALLTEELKTEEELESQPLPAEKTPEQLLEEERTRLKEEQLKLEKERKKLEDDRKKFEDEAKAKKELEEKKLAERQEKERLEQEHLRQQQKLEETIAAVTNTNVQRYEKEYLNDYAVSGYTFDMKEDKQNSTILFKNPDKADEFGVTLLMEAAEEGNDWKIKALINAGADVNLKDKDGWTALMYAIRYHGNMNCVDLLINAGADVKAQNNYGTSALILASNYNSNPEILKKLLSYYSPNEKDVLKSFIQVLTENQDDEYIQMIKVNLFLDISVPLNSLFNGKTPLMYAAESGRSTKVIGMLLENSNTGIRSREGKTAFDYAKENPKLNHDDIYWALNNK